MRIVFVVVDYNHTLDFSIGYKMLLYKTDVSYVRMKPYKSLVIEGCLLRFSYF